MESTPNMESIMNRVAKMLALANDRAASEGERDNAMRMVQKILAKYNLEMSDIQGRTGKKEEAREKHRSSFYGRSWAMLVAQDIAKMCFCFYMVTRSRHANKIHTFVGRESNTRTAAILAEFVIDSIRKEALFQKRRAGSYGHDNFTESFCFGARGAVHRRVKEMLAGDHQDGSEKALVCTTYKTEEQANMAFAGAFRKGSAIRSRIHNQEAYQKGHEYGAKMSLSRQVNDSSSPDLKRLGS